MGGVNYIHFENMVDNNEFISLQYFMYIIDAIEYLFGPSLTILHGNPQDLLVHTWVLNIIPFHQR